MKFSLHRNADRTTITLVGTRQNDDGSRTQAGHLFTNEEPMYLRLDHYMANMESAFRDHDEKVALANAPST